MCPKCHRKAVVTKHLGYQTVMNMCTNCGCSHVIGASKESLERQVKGDNWQNPRRNL
jgi:hypothetical protein